MKDLDLIKARALGIAESFLNILAIKEVKLVLTVVFTAAGLTFIGFKVNQTWAELGGYFENINILWSFGSLPILIISFFLFAYGWSLILRRLTDDFSTPKVTQIWAKAQLGKYIPGLGVHFFARLELLASEGITRRTTFVSTVIEMSLLLVTAVIVALIALTNVSGSETVALFIDDIVKDYGVLYVAGLTIGIVIAILFINPIPIRWLANRIGGADTHRFTYRWLVLLISFNTIRWIFMGFGFFMLARAVYPVGYVEIPFVIGAFTLSWAIGLLVVFAPGGIGVREVMLVILMEQVMPSGAAVALAAVARIWWIMGELLLLFFSTFALRLANNKSLQTFMKMPKELK